MNDAGTTQTAIGTIHARFSCRVYSEAALSAEHQRALRAYLSAQTAGPFGSPVRLALVAAEPGDAAALKGLGTYGFIKGATAFLVGAVTRGPKDLEDYGYVVERAILHATGLGVGSCWLGGTFTRSRFVRRFGGLRAGEVMPAVVSLGYPGEDGAGRIHEREASSRRLPASSLFFDRRLDTPIVAAALGDFAPVLHAVRMAPSASNKQPWRLVRLGRDWDFYLQRTKGYGKGSALYTVLRLADLQRVDLGIAMCHFELAARELGMTGVWLTDEPHDPAPHADGLEYVATWRPRAEAPTP